MISLLATTSPPDATVPSTTTGTPAAGRATDTELGHVAGNARTESRSEAPARWPFQRISRFFAVSFFPESSQRLGPRRLRPHNSFRRAAREQSQQGEHGEASNAREVRWSWLPQSAAPCRTANQNHSIKRTIRPCRSESGFVVSVCIATFLVDSLGAPECEQNGI